jgi:hypothetical protein
MCLTLTHKHVHCEHEVQYCKVCDVCYCAKCGMEWKRNAPQWGYQEPFLGTLRGQAIPCSTDTVSCKHD